MCTVFPGFPSVLPRLLPSVYDRRPRGHRGRDLTRCGICRRSLLLGESAAVFQDDRTRAIHTVCALCTQRAERAGRPSASPSRGRACASTRTTPRSTRTAWCSACRPTWSGCSAARRRQRPADQLALRYGRRAGSRLGAGAGGEGARRGTSPRSSTTSRAATRASTISRRSCARRSRSTRPCARRAAARRTPPTSAASRPRSSTARRTARRSRTSRRGWASRPSASPRRASRCRAPYGSSSAGSRAGAATA